MTDRETNEPVAWRTTTTDGRHTHFTENGRIAEQWSESGFDVTPLFISTETPSPASQTMGTEDQRGVGIGMAIAAGIIMRCWGQEVYAREILGAAGLDTLDKLKASGVDQYDIDALTPVVATTEGQP